MSTIKVVCGIVRHDERYLAAQRPEDKDQSFLWELPGGKVEGDETYVDAIKRELFEELGLTVKVLAGYPPHRHAYPNQTIELYPVLCEAWTASFQLYEHMDAGWFTAEELRSLDWCPADVSIVHQHISVSGKG